MISEQLRLLNFSVFLYDQSTCPFVCQYSYFFIKELTSIKYQGGSLARYFTVNEIKIDPFMRQIKKRFWGNWGNGNTSLIFYPIFCLIWHPIITQNKKYCHSIWGIEKELRIKLIRSDHGRSSWSASCSADILLFSFTIYLSVKMKEMKIM